MRRLAAMAPKKLESFAMRLWCAMIADRASGILAGNWLSRVLSKLLALDHLG
jgi:hypothetical protein